MKPSRSASASHSGFTKWTRKQKPTCSEKRIPDLRRLDAITDFGLQHFRSAYPLEAVSREDIFHYVYGVLHSEDYRSRYRANLAKELPRIPRVKPVEDYRAFRDAGKRLGELHVGFEDVDPFPATIDTGGQIAHG